MKFRYSIQLPADENPTADLAGTIPVRRHCTPFKEDFGALRAQQDWRELIGPLQDFKGGLSAKYGLMQVAVPECLPERLEIIAYASEIGFLYDDWTENLSADELNKANDNMQSAFDEGLQMNNSHHNMTGIETIQMKLFTEMASIDKPRAMVTMRFWIEFLQQAAGRQHETTHTSFSEYMQYRVLDVGEMFWLGLVTFGMALTIHDQEIALIRSLTRPCWIVLALQNDICSYTKEENTARVNGTTHIVNALWILVKRENMTFQDALAFCKNQISTCITEYEANLEACQDNDALSADSKVYLESLLYTMSGDAAWSLITPRYNANQKYNDLQVMMMEHGVENVLPDLAENKWRTNMASVEDLHDMPQSLKETA